MPPVGNAGIASAGVLLGSIVAAFLAMAWSRDARA